MSALLVSVVFSGSVMFELISEDWLGVIQGWKRVVFQIRRRGVGASTKM